MSAPLVTGQAEDVLDPAILGYRRLARHLLQVRDEDLATGGPFRYTRVPAELDDLDALIPVLDIIAPGTRGREFATVDGTDGATWIGPIEDWRPENHVRPYSIGSHI
ncbi:hypothetical protein HOT75_gp064 [Gordonia phage Daredevil]|uniref:Uncharacterized protein n=1 Tax=Gordonia phage Daredevil TaxID=2283286 RepID=A0A345MIS0_9CAUD|nr:hypothetical protein HOT75_gp064 [Gordonia phage Daredevil]AXH70451.1 hypothetical protein SEA_DAREDEVIL_64 [Gordonia phage Daredevil]